MMTKYFLNDTVLKHLSDLVLGPAFTVSSFECRLQFDKVIACKGMLSNDTSTNDGRC